jgi:glycerol-3-phosphate dehydrogenase
MARTVEDFLSRRRRVLLLDAKKSLEIVPEVARLMADAMQKDAAWIQNQIADYRKLANGYILSS